MQPTRISREDNPKRQDEIYDDGVLQLQPAATAQDSGPTKTQVTSIALQMDMCDTLYVTKNTLVAYTIAVIQNTQTLHYDQMHVALQTTQNSASLETPL